MSRLAVAILLGYNIAIQALHHHLAFIGCINHAVLAFIQADVLACLGIASLILWKQGTEATQATQAAPAELGWQGIDFLRLLHHGIVDAYLLASWEEFADYIFLLFGIERRCHLVHDAGKIWLEGSDCLADVFLVGDHPHVLHGTDGLEAVDGELDE